MGKSIAYLRISTNQQDLDSQRLAILKYAHSQNIKIDEFIEISISSRQSLKDRRIDELLQKLEQGDMLIVSELSRLGRSVGQVVMIIEELIKNRVNFTAIKEQIFLNAGKAGIQTKAMITIFSLLGELERELISMRTKEGLSAAREKGKLLGRRPGSFSNHRLDGKDEQIKLLLSKEVSKAAIAKILGVPRTTLLYFIKTRKLEQKNKA